MRLDRPGPGRLVAGAVAVVLLGSAGCSVGEEPVAAPTRTVVTPTPVEEPDGASVPDLEEQSCREIVAAAAGAREAFDESLDDITAAPEAFAQVAANIRAAATDAGAEVAAVAEDLALALDAFADDLRSFQVPSFDGVTSALTELDEVCGS